ncbi:MAG: hypothetical protein V1746_07355 [bacterium]
MLRYFFAGAIFAMATLSLASAQDQPASEKSAGVPKIDLGTTPPVETAKAEWDLPVQLDKRVGVGKIYDFLNDATITKTGGNRPLNFELKYFSHGAVTKEQKKQKAGWYYVVHWGNDGAPADFTLRFDYRQAKTKDEVHSLSVKFPKAAGSHKASFSVVGDAYQNGGKITSWRAAVVRDGVIVAQKKSYVW